MRNLTVNLISESPYFPKEHGVHTAFLNIAEMLKNKGVKVMVNSPKKADITHIHTVGPLAWYKLLTSKNTLVSAHIIPPSFVGSIVLSKYWLPEAAAYLKFFYNQADLVLAVSETVKRELQKIGVSKPLEVLPNPINNKIFKRDQNLKREGRKLLGLKEDDFVVLGVGQIQPRKGIETFIEVARNLPRFQFFWVGGRPIKNLTAGTKKLDRLIEEKPKNLHFTKEIPYEQMPRYYNLADVFFFPSYQETQGLVVIEAAAVGLPLVLRNLPEYRLLYKKGYLAGTDKDFTAMISKLATDKDYYLQCSEGAKSLSTKFTFDILGDKLIQLYQSLLKQP